LKSGYKPLKALKRVNSAVAPKKATDAQGKPISNGLNAYNSLNRANRIRGLAKIIDENKSLLDKLQNTKSTYDRGKWE